jgi:hypothetical protein
MADMLRILLLVSGSVFLLFDEEPVFDFSDWNVTHVLLFAVSLFVVIWENSMRARLGQWVYKDQVLLFASLTFY